MFDILNLCQVKLVYMGENRFAKFWPKNSQNSRSYQVQNYNYMPMLEEPPVPTRVKLETAETLVNVQNIGVMEYKARHAHKRLYTVLPKYSKIQVLPGITSCRLMKYNKQAIELNSLLINNMPKDGYEWS